MKFLASMLCIHVLASSLSAAEVDFAHDIVPLLKQHCGKCHTGDSKKGGLSFNTRQDLLTGGESGKVVIPGKSDQSDLLKRLNSADDEERMPPKSPPLPAEKIALVKKWIDAGLPWEEGFTFGKRSYEPPLKPRRPTLPAAVNGRENPVDRILDAQLAGQKKPRPATVDDAGFARRAYLDIVGLLPTPDELEAFLKDSAKDKRAKLIRELLDRDVDYAEHWLTFWNDLLRNDYTGTGFITGGRKQISKWLYAALLTNKPYDQFARELIAPPTAESAGFIDGIRWRGEVSAGQTVEIQFAQSIAQSFLGINLKCASCHDSFIDRWTLDEAYGIAAIYANAPMEIHRCDKPTGRKGQAAWLFPELGQVDAKAPQPERLKQLAGLMTHPENGRFTRTIVNRIWHRMMGRGIVHPTDAMQTEPWNADLLDYLASDLAEQKYDLKKTIELIATSQAYQSKAEVVGKGADDHGYSYAGPRARRMTAEQFMDAVWQITDAAPTKIDAPVVRGKRKPVGSAVRTSGETDDIRPAQPTLPKPKPLAVTGKWIWSRADTNGAAAGETITLQRTITLKAAPVSAIAVITCDNSYSIAVNGKHLHAGENWEAPDTVALTGLKAGANEIIIVAKNGGTGPNPAGLFFEARITDAKGAVEVVASDAQWRWTSEVPDKNGKFKKAPALTDWKPAALVTTDPWSGAVAGPIAAGFERTPVLEEIGEKPMVRASLVKCDFLMQSLGRPNREQIVSVRPADLSTLEAINLSNGPTLADALERGSKKLLARNWKSPEEFVRWLYQFALSREPSTQELSVFREALGAKLSEQGVQDALWSIVMLPEFQLVR
jgi:hypothetical protein